VTSYGRREIGMSGGRSAFVQLLEAVEQVEGLERVRFTAPHPKGYGEDLVAAYGRLNKLCPSAHLPVQSGSDRVLKLMHRGYTRAHFVAIVDQLRRVRPEMGITTDLIVGFPGETELDFEQTLDLVQEVEFDQAYVFKYSPRKETPAAQMPDQVPQEVRETRNYRLLSVVNEVGRRRYEREVGRRVQVLVEGPSRRNAARLEGRTGTNKLVVFEGNERHLGQVLEMKVVRTGSFTLYGDPAILNLEEEAEGGRAGET
jgi:tRNA-2-methylthio-N6-dimethylallyladenosine synthase